MSAALTDTVLVVLVVAFAFGFRWVTLILDRNRIREYLEKGGNRLIDNTWNRFGPGWWGSDGERIYDVRYETRHGQAREGTCKTGLFSGVYWTGEAPPYESAENHESYTTGHTQKPRNHE